MKTKDFYFDLPEELIAQNPPAQRGQSRLLVYRRATGEIIHSWVADLAGFLEPETLMVFNDTKVRHARLLGESHHGGQFETLLLERDQEDPALWLCMARKAARLKPGMRLRYPGNVTAEVVACQDEYRRLRFSPAIDDEWLDRFGHIPLPPYIKRPDGNADAERYQTIYAGPRGSVAAPTAGLHFTQEILADLDGKGIVRRNLTLHVGLGTFLPVRSEDVSDHRMHREQYSVSQELASACQAVKAKGKPVLAVGTTSLRTLESASDQSGNLSPGAGSTDIFITPGYKFRCVDQLFTNFHTPESTLLMLVSAFAGFEEIKRVYQIAIQERYRFFSYGDAMLIQ